MLICPPPLDWNGMSGPVGGGGRTGELFGSPAWFRSDKEWPLWWGVRRRTHWDVGASQRTARLP